MDSESRCDASVPSASLVIDVKKDQFHAKVDFEFTGVSHQLLLLIEHIVFGVV